MYDYYQKSTHSITASETRGARYIYVIPLMVKVILIIINNNNTYIDNIMQRYGFVEIFNYCYRKLQ